MVVRQVTVAVATYMLFLGCIKCTSCRLLLSMIAVCVCQTVTRFNLAVHTVCAGSFGAAFAKSLWPLVPISITDIIVS